MNTKASVTGYRLALSEGGKCLETLSEALETVFSGRDRKKRGFFPGMGGKL